MISNPRSSALACTAALLGALSLTAAEAADASQTSASSVRLQAAATIQQNPAPHRPASIHRAGRSPGKPGVAGEVRVPGKPGRSTLEKAFARNRGQIGLGTLYAAVPGSVLALGDAMIESAMSAPPFAGTSEGRPVWGRLSAATQRADVVTGLRMPGITANHTERFKSNTLTAQFGTPVYRSAQTQIDATFGIGARSTDIHPTRQRAPELRTYSAAIGAVIQHRGPAEIDLRLGTQLSGGGSTLKGPGMKARGRNLQERFRHIGVGLRAELSRDFPVGAGVVVTPLVGVGVSTAWVQQSRDHTDNNSAASAWMSTRLAYHHTLRTGREAGVWVEPTYISQFKRSTTITKTFAGINLDVRSSLPRDRAGLRIGLDLPVGKQGALQATVGRFWGVGNARQRGAQAHIGYIQRF